MHEKYLVPNSELPVESFAITLWLIIYVYYATTFSDKSAYSTIVYLLFAHRSRRVQKIDMNLYVLYQAVSASTGNLSRALQAVNFPLEPW